jgi:quercetin dioxygenase-like cupin family protein
VKAMKIIVLKNTPREREECCNKTKIWWLITPEVGAQNTTRLFEMDSGGYSSLHKHAWEHVVYVLEGEGLVFDGEKTQQIKNGDSVFVAPNDLHQFQNKSQKTLAFLCIEPSTKE